MGDLEDFSRTKMLKRIKDVREERGYSHEACAEALGFSDRSQYGKRESGTYDFTDAELIKLRKFLDMPSPWPFLAAEDIYRVQMAREASRSPEFFEVSQRFSKYLTTHPDLSPELRREMAGRARFDFGEWDDSDIDLVRVIAQKHLRGGQSR